MQAVKSVDTEKIFLNSLSSEEKQKLYREIYSKDNSFQKAYGQDFVEFECEKYANLFRNKITQVLLDKGILSENIPLEELHNHIPEELKAYDYDYGINEISNHFYKIDAEFEDLYIDFVKHYISKVVTTEPFYFQMVPTIRLHCPDAKNSHHYPRYHTDIGYGHPPEIVNVWLPLTKPVGEQKHGFSVMGFEDSKIALDKEDFNFDVFISKAINSKEFNTDCERDSQEAATEFGNLMIFDPRCLHTGEPMLQHTRVSIDVRIIKVEDYENSPIAYQGAGRTKALFAPGHCYSNLKSEDL